MSRLRLLFKKTGRAKYISHLDLMRTMGRAFLRAGAELRYSQGFNPHPYISAALPLPVGCESVCELLDFEPLNASDDAGMQDLAGSLNAALPEGISVLKVYTPLKKFSEIEWVEVRGRLFYNGEAPLELADRCAEFFEAADSIIIQKKTKSGVSELDVKPHIISAGLYVADDKELTISARLRCNNPSVTTGDLLGALGGFWDGREPELALFRRIEVYDTNHKVFR